MKSEEDVEAWYSQQKENAWKIYQEAQDVPGSDKKYRATMEKVRARYDRDMRRVLTAQEQKAARKPRKSWVQFVFSFLRRSS